jgi:3-phenylpropionate/trans-cinnamate dioxygenase ferredoxin subunit
VSEPGFCVAARLEDVPAGRSCRVTIGGTGVLLCRVGDDVFAVADVCTHDRGPLGEGRLRGYTIECPRHGARFDVRDGKVLAKPAIRPIRSFPVRVDGGEVLVREPLEDA